MKTKFALITFVIILLGTAFSHSASAQGNKLYVGNLSYDTNRESLIAAFSSVGEVREVVIVMDRETGKPRGFAFVTMGSAQAAASAISQLNGVMLDGRPIKVNEAQERTARPSGGGGGFGGGGGRGSGLRVEKPLDENGANALVTEATGWLAGLIDDEDITDNITTSWDERDDLIGKTRTQALALMLIDAKRIITDKAVLDKFVKGWNAKAHPAPRQW
ncbi:MAG: hypothetical protein KA746_12875 [Pyrinomonadaceae bacterium]|nr:hypothetical protein [Pyrinomonadaceae bacterium]